MTAQETDTSITSAELEILYTASRQAAIEFETMCRLLDATNTKLDATFDACNVIRAKADKRATYSDAHTS